MHKVMGGDRNMRCKQGHGLHMAGPREVLADRIPPPHKEGTWAQPYPHVLPHICHDARQAIAYKIFHDNVPLPRQVINHRLAEVQSQTDDVAHLLKCLPDSPPIANKISAENNGCHQQRQRAAQHQAENFAMQAAQTPRTARQCE